MLGEPALGPSLVVVDKGMAGSLTTTTLNKGTYAFFFNQRGLMGGLGLQGLQVVPPTDLAAARRSVSLVDTPPRPFT